MPKRGLKSVRRVLKQGLTCVGLGSQMVGLESEMGDLRGSNGCGFEG